MTHQLGFLALIGSIALAAPAAELPVTTPPQLTDAALEVALQLRLADGVHALPASGTVTIAGSTWHCESSWTSVPGRSGCFAYQATVTLTAGGALGAVVELTSSRRGWDPTSFVFVPAAVYDGNRFEVVDVPYSPFWPDASHYRVDKPTSVTNQPRLASDGSAARIELDTGSTATPCVGFRTPDGQGFLLLTEQRDDMGNHGLTIREMASSENPTTHQAQFTVSSPSARTRSANIIGFRTGDPLSSWTVGNRATLRARMWTFPAPTVQTLFERFAECRKDFGSVTKTNAAPFGAMADLVRERINTDNWDAALGYYRHAPDRLSTKALDWWQLGWVTGGITTLPMLLSGNQTEHDRAWTNLTFMFTQSPVSSGLYRTVHNGKNWCNDDPRPPRPGYQLAVRRQCDALYYGLKQVRILSERGEVVPAEWTASLHGLANALVRVWEANGQLGQWLDIRNGSILIGGTNAAALLPAGLTLAAQQFKEPRYLAIAEAVARQQVHLALTRGYTNGGPCDALAAPDSESSFALIESLSNLHDATGQSEWTMANAALIRQFATWVTSYDFTFPAASHLGRVNAPATGTVWANVQNKHAAPNICTSSGDALLRYWRATGDALALDLLRDIAHNAAHYVSRADRPLGMLQPGMMCERVNLSDWEGTSDIGGNLFGSVIWVETAMLLIAQDIPGVYVRSDTDRVEIFDHVEATLHTNADGKILTIRNPTSFATTVTVLVEDAAAVTRPLPLHTLRGARRVPVPAGGTVDIKL